MSVMRFLPLSLASQHTNLCMSSTLRRRAIKVFQDQSIDSMNTMIHTRRHDIHNKQILLWRVQSQLSRRAKHQRADIHSSARVGRRDVLCVQTDRQMHAAQKVVGGNRGHGNDFSGMLHACCVLAGSEDGDVAGGGAEGFLTFVALLAWLAALAGLGGKRNAPELTVV